MKLLLALVFIGAAFAVSKEIRFKMMQNFKDEVEFRRWATTHNKTYSTKEEYHKRFGIYKRNKVYIESHNLARKTNTEMFLGINQFADLENEEFRKLYLMPKRDFTSSFANGVQQVEALPGLPDSIDWRSQLGYSVVSPVKNQGQCGSCWSFSTTGSIEGLHGIKNRRNPTGLSEKNLMDCSWPEGDQGCNGGLMSLAFEYVMKNGGIDSESSYPYQPVSSHTCRYNSRNRVPAVITSYTNVTVGSESDLLNKAAAQPVSVAIDAGSLSFQFYSGGVYYSPFCSSTQLDHGVLVAGYGTYQGSKYWLVKNSWGEGWGLNGYIMMSRDRNNNCGIATCASVPNIGGPLPPVNMA